MWSCRLDARTAVGSTSRVSAATRRVQQRLRCYCNVFAMLHYVKYKQYLFDDEGSTKTWYNFLARSRAADADEAAASIAVGAGAGAGTGAGAGAGAGVSTAEAEARQTEFLRRLQEVLLSPDVLFHEQLYRSLQQTQVRRWSCGRCAVGASV